MKKEKVIIAITIGLMSFVLVCVMFMQFKVVNETDIAEIESMREDELQSALSEWKEKYEEEVVRDIVEVITEKRREMGYC